LRSDAREVSYQEIHPVTNDQSVWKEKSVEEGVGASNTELISELGVVALGDNAGTAFSGSSQEGDKAYS